jgi:hypothetical protein
MVRELRDVPLRPAGGMCACRRAHSDRQQVSAGARASPSWIGGRRRPTRRHYVCTDYCVKLDDELGLFLKYCVRSLEDWFDLVEFRLREFQVSNCGL